MLIPSTPEQVIRYSTSILSSTVIAEDCMTADALATSFMVMELEEAEKNSVKQITMIVPTLYIAARNGESLRLTIRMV